MPDQITQVFTSMRPPSHVTYGPGALLRQEEMVLHTEPCDPLLAGLCSELYPWNHSGFIKKNICKKALFPKKVYHPTA